MEQEQLNRRSFIVRTLWGFSAVLGTLTLIPVVGALFAPLFRKVPQAWRQVGKVDDYEIGKTVLVKYKNALPLPWSGLSSETASWLQRVSKDEFIAFSINCAHLGCQNQPADNRS